MCGIAGIIKLNNTSPEETELKKMMASIKHRGPDDEGCYIDKSTGLGFVRLSILDLTAAGHQPMLSEDKNLALVFNGEIFNYLELREELQSLGYVFTTNTDTEVLLKSYQQWGEACQHKFNGMWAFVIYDKLNESLFISRDRFGVKPFYYSLEENEMIFASEIPAILEARNKRPAPDLQVIFDFMVFNRTDHSEHTFFDGIKKLQHGHCMKVDLKSKLVNIYRWYSLRHNLKEGFTSENEFYDYFKSSVDIRMRSDVPVGVCLSGGLDSSSILSVLLTEEKNKNIDTFSAVYNPGDIGDETNFINEYRPIVKNMHFVQPDADSFFSDIHNYVRAFAEPIPSTSAYAQFRVMSLAKGKVTVLLDGQGADEQLAGYHYFFGLYFKELLFKGKIATLLYEMGAYYRKHKSLFGLKSFVFFLLPKKLRTKARVSEKGYLLKDFSKKYKSDNGIADNLYGSKNLKEALLDHFEFKMEHHLKWSDFSSMWFSIESRVPFLDHRLVEKSLSLAPDQIIKNGTTKYILREAMKGILPEKIRNRGDKIGFDTPEAEWFKEPKFKALVDEILNSVSFKERNIVDPQSAKNLYQKHLNGEINVSKEIWKWVHLELWFREFIDRKTSKAQQIQLCRVGIWDSTMPGILFDKNGVSNFCLLQQKMMSDYPRGEKGKNDWLELVKKIKRAGQNQKYDCIIGVSGGVDSSYLLHLASAHGLRPLAVHLDNGFNSEISVDNIFKLTNALNFDLKTHVINYEEIKDLFKSYMKAGMPWIDIPTDLAIKATMYKMALNNNIKYIIRGNDFRSEGKQPNEWTYSDARQLKYIHKHFGSGKKLKTYPYLTLFTNVYAGFVRKIRDVRPFYYLEYNKQEAKAMLIEKYGWKDYGGHHHENLFTKFAMAYWLPVKFGIDKRKINLSAQILSEAITRDEALHQISQPFDSPGELLDLKNYVIKKLDLGNDEFEKIMGAANKNYLDYPSNYDLVYKNIKHFKWLVRKMYDFKPMSIDSNEMIR